VVHGIGPVRLERVGHDDLVFGVLGRTYGSVGVAPSFCPLRESGRSSPGGIVWRTPDSFNVEWC
jgi:hypothetical protein